MAIFRTDFEALVYILIIFIALYLLNRGAKIFVFKIKNLERSDKNRVLFAIRLVSIGLLVYLIIEGFPSYTEIDPEYTALVSGSVSAALAFATSEIFANFIAGILIFIIDPFDVGDVVKIKGNKGIIKLITLTKVVVETFDGVIVEIANKDVASSMILNYTIRPSNTESFYYFRKDVEAPQDVGDANLNMDLEGNVFNYEPEIKDIFEKIKDMNDPTVHAYTFTMHFDYDQFRVKVDKARKVCENYKTKFGYTPTFHVVKLANDITVKFRILTLNALTIMQYQPPFAKDLYLIIYGD